MGKMSGDPNGAALTTPNECDAEAPAAGSITGCVGRNGAKCAFLSSQRKTKQKKQTNQSNAILVALHEHLEMNRHSEESSGSFMNSIKNGSILCWKGQKKKTKKITLRWVPFRVRLRRAECRTSCAGWGARRRRRWRPVGTAPPAASNDNNPFLSLGFIKCRRNQATHLGVHVGAVHVHLAAALVHRGADLRHLRRPQPQKKRYCGTGALGTHAGTVQQRLHRATMAAEMGPSSKSCSWGTFLEGLLSKGDSQLSFFRLQGGISSVTLSSKTP